MSQPLKGLWDRATLRRELTEGRISRDTYTRRLVQLLHVEAGLPVRDGLDQHADEALAVIR